MAYGIPAMPRRTKKKIQCEAGYISSYTARVLTIALETLDLKRGTTMTRRGAAAEIRQGRDRDHKAHSVEHVYGALVPEALHEAIETERDNLSKAESLLACMVVSMKYENDPLTGPYYPAVAQIARELVERSINGLDPLVLKQRLLRNKIEEGFCMSFIDQAYLSSAPTSSGQALIGSRLSG